mmetsp:Transcript_22080/g.42894  ORF Transcript_22080/g.42894 Transcript_22080/m.42894 type:complete len:231 (+) Transcript_22080:62-754(+)
MSLKSNGGSDSKVLKAKTVLLVRHAESVENVRVRAAKATWRRIRGLRLPQASQIWETLKLLGLQHDADLSEKGTAMASDAKVRLESSGLMNKVRPDLVVHSTYIRAVKTYQLMLAPLTKTVPVVSSELLVERKLSEHVYAANGFRQRVANFERWLDARPEVNVVVVGHSQFFKQMLGVACSVHKFDNCDVWEYRRSIDDSGKARWEEIGKRFSSELSVDESKDCELEDSQ